MKLELSNNKDVWAGADADRHRRGRDPHRAQLSVRHRAAHGAGLSSRSCSAGCWSLFGLYILAVGLRSSEKIEGSWSLRALIVLPLSLVLFGVLMEHAGFVPALLVLIFGSAAASTEFRLVEVLLFSVGLTALCGRGVHLGARPALSADHRPR